MTTDLTSLAQTAYASGCQAIAAANRFHFLDEPPAWDQLAPTLQAGWVAAVEAVRIQTLTEAADAVDRGKQHFDEPVRGGASWAARMLRRMAEADQ